MSALPIWQQANTACPLIMRRARPESVQVVIDKLSVTAQAIGIAITKIVPGENKLTVSGTAKPNESITLSTVPEGTNVIAVSDANGNFVAEACARRGRLYGGCCAVCRRGIHKGHRDGQFRCYGIRRTAGSGCGRRDQCQHNGCRKDKPGHYRHADDPRLYADARR